MKIIKYYFLLYTDSILKEGVRMKILAMLVLGFSFMFGAVDINNADKSELMSLKGVGAKKADTILAYSASHCFKSINELQNVKGIGPKFIEKNKSELTVGACKK